MDDLLFGFIIDEKIMGDKVFFVTKKKNVRTKWI